MNNRILIPRPEHSRTDSLIHQLKSLGCQPIHMPLINCSFINVDFPCLQDYDVLLCTSGRAAEAIVREKPETMRDFITSGKQTAEILRRHGYTAHYPSQGVGSEAMLQSSYLNNVNHKKILLITGRERRPLLEQVLIKRGGKLDKIVVYKCSPCYYTASQWNEVAPLNMIWITSGRILITLYENIIKYQLRWLYQSRLMVVSERLSQLARELSFYRLVELPDAYNETLCDYISQLNNSSGN